MMMVTVTKSSANTYILYHVHRIFIYLKKLLTESWIYAKLYYWAWVLISIHNIRMLVKFLCE